MMVLAGKYERMRHEDPTLVLKLKEVSRHLSTSWVAGKHVSTHAHARARTHDFHIECEAPEKGMHRPVSRSFLLSY